MPGWKLFLIAFFTLAGQGPAFSQTRMPGRFAIALSAGHKVWLEGRAGPGAFSCSATRLQTEGHLEMLAVPAAGGAPHGRVVLVVVIPVKALDCGNSLMNRDMRQALRADSFPEIRYELVSYAAEGRNAGDSGALPFRFDALGKLTISGQTRLEKAEVTGEALQSDAFRIRGALKIDMTAFGITPPIGLFGLVRVDKVLTVHVDVTARIQGPAPSPDS